MRYTKRAILSFAFAVLCGFAFAHHLQPAGAADDAVVAEAEKVYPMIYAVKDLPVWTGSVESEDVGKFDPTILMAYIKASVDSKSWGERSTMQPYLGNLCLVISTTSANHGAISDLLQELRSATSPKSSASK